MFEKAAFFSGLLVLLIFLVIGNMYYPTLVPEDKAVPVLDKK